MILFSTVVTGKVTGKSFDKQIIVYDVEVTKVYRGVSIIHAYNVESTDYHCSKIFLLEFKTGLEVNVRVKFMVIFHTENRKIDNHQTKPLLFAILCNVTFSVIQILTYDQHLGQLSSEGSLACTTYCDTGHPSKWSSPRTRDTHLFPSV